MPRTQAGELRALLRLRDTAVSLLNAEAALSEDTSDLQKIRAQLNHRNDSYVRVHGSLNRFTVRTTGRPDPRTGEPGTARVATPQGGFRGDPYAPLVYALEEFDAAGQRAVKAPIFTGRVVAPRTPRLGADTPADALAICLDTHGEPRPGEIARLLGLPDDQARRELGTLVFDDPESHRLVPAAEYLSGNVRAKLATARRAALDDPRYAVNAEELAKVIPADLQPGQVDARLSAAWIDPDYVQQFLREILDDPNLTAEHPGGQVWGIQGKTGTVLPACRCRIPPPSLASPAGASRRVRTNVGSADGLQPSPICNLTCVYILAQTQQS